jgi:hypothetical protein
MKRANSSHFELLLPAAMLLPPAPPPEEPASCLLSVGDMSGLKPWGTSALRKGWGRDEMQSEGGGGKRGGQEEREVQGEREGGPRRPQ